MVEQKLAIMWEHQQAFQVAVCTSAQESFGAIDESFQARVFLLGFRVTDDITLPSISMEPADLDYVTQYFEEVPYVADQLVQQIKGPPDSAIFQSGQMSSGELYAWKAALEQILYMDDQERGRQSFVAWPVVVEAYLVFCVLQLSRKTWNSYYALKHTSQHAGDAFSAPRSLLYALVEEFLEGCTRALLLPNPGSQPYVIDRSKEELHRNAGRHLMKTVAHACQNYELVESLYDALSELSATHYEGTENAGRMLVAPPEHACIAVRLRLSRPVQLTDTRAVSKLLQMTTHGLWALMDGSAIYGLGLLSGDYDEEEENVFMVTFAGYHAWKLVHAGFTLMQVRHGLPYLSTRTLDTLRLRSIIRRIFAGVPDVDAEHLIRLTLTGTQQGRGTILVISDHAKWEAMRLSTQAMPIDAVPMDEQLIDSVTAIDGAVLIDPSGVCYAIGVILDGLASDRGTASRGARYNSAIRYVQTAHTLGHRCVAIVVSEDGPIDIFPDLLPQIKRSLILDKVEAFRAMLENKQVRRRDFNRFMDWFQQRRFFLWKEICTEINSIRRQIEQKLEPTRIWISWPEFEPNPELDETFFIDENET